MSSKRSLTVSELKALTRLGVNADDLEGADDDC